MAHDANVKQLGLRQWQGGLEFRTLAETIPCLVFVTDSDGQNIYTNVQFQRYAGVDAEALRGNGWLDVLHPEDRERAAATWSRSTIDLEPYDARYRFRRRDGAFRWHIVRGSPLANPFGGVARWIGSCTDVDDILTSAMVAEPLVSVLAEVSGNQNTQLQATIDALPIIVWEAGPKGEIERVNAAWHANVFGPETNTPTFRDIIAPVALGEFLSRWEFCIAAGEIFECETIISDRFSGEMIVTALAIPTWLGDESADQGRWIGSFQRADRNSSAAILLTAPIPITPDICVDNGQARLVYFHSTSLDGWSYPEVACWEGNEWVVAGKPVDWPTHWLPLPNLGTGAGDR